jgi:hypothetical protein
MNFQDHKGTWHAEFNGVELPKQIALSECGARARAGRDAEGLRTEIPRSEEIPAGGKECACTKDGYEAKAPANSVVGKVVIDKPVFNKAKK